MKKTNVKGFTIIEVVLVLAIAGLIFLVVFLALPALQRQQRDTQRRSDASRASSLMSNFKANNNGGLPTTAAAQTSFENTYLKVATEFKSPSTQAQYAVTWVVAANLVASNSSTNTDTAFFAPNHSCTGDQLVSNIGKFAVRMPLENGGAYCVGEN
ncbi:MAG: prepilin-type N-terminal cleavage/methylation domain-containing protein [Candidatus Saccharimonadales bacterium]